jgi:glycosyltransferase involved in cell wall biosynthesis
VVIPVHNGGRAFERCLRGLRASTWTAYELIVVDDGSTDGSAALAEAYGARLVRTAKPHGPAAARNAGAQIARAPIVFFLDADVALQPTALTKTMARFQANPGLAALFGSYDDQPADPGLVSRYRNLLHHYVHQQGDFQNQSRPARTFWTGCGAIRLNVFLELGGFDPRLYRRPAIEDIELGFRLTQAGHRIELVRDIQATHLKRWTLIEVIRTDVFRRGLPWMLLLLRTGVSQSDLNVSPGQRLSVVCTAVGLLGLLVASWFPAGLGMIVTCLGLILLLNIHFYQFLWRRGGFRFALASVPLHLAYFVCCGVSVVLALVIWKLPSSWIGDSTAEAASVRRDRGRGSSVPAPWHRRLSRRWLRNRS